MRASETASKLAKAFASRLKKPAKRDLKEVREKNYRAHPANGGDERERAGGLLERYLVPPHGARVCDTVKGGQRNRGLMVA